jgi:phage terminase large subunit GpA-like protein
MAMVDGGRWRATKPDVLSHAGFRVNALVSPHANVSWAKLAAEFMTAKRSADTLQTFVNTILAEGWREDAEELDENELAARVEPFGLQAVPAAVLLVTAGVDVQRDRLEIVFLGHGREETFVLANVVLWGDPLHDDLWAELDELLRTAWPHPNGGTLRVDAAAVDAGDGAMMDRVLAFTRARLGRRIVAIKGASGNRPAIQRSAAKGMVLFIVGVDGLKGQLSSRLSRGRSIRFSQDLEPRYFEELASERCVVRYKKGAWTARDDWSGRVVS